MKNTLIVLIVYLLTCICAPSHAAELTPYQLPNAYTTSLTSSVNGKEYNLYIKLPKHYADNKKAYPLVLVNDADYAFPIVSSIFRRMGQVELQDAIVVGVSYSKGDSPQVSRTRDYTPTHSPNERHGHSKQAKLQSGKANQYMQFLSKDVLPLIKRSYRINSSKTIFVGHSFGALAGSYILFNQPSMFSHYLLGSPSLWYGNKVVFRMEERFATQHKALNSRIYMATGELEEQANNALGMVSNMTAFHQQLASRQYQGLALKSEILANETHISSFPVMVSNGLRWALPINK